MAVQGGAGPHEELAREKLEEELTCSICLDLYQDPRQLPCLHAYCTSCLSNLLSRAKNRRITCPKCGTNIQTQGEDQVERFPKAFKLNRLKDIYQDMVAVAKEKGGEGRMCLEHPEQELALFCETCNVAMCRDCFFMNGKEHIEHRRGYIKELGPKHRAEFASELREMEGKVAAASSRKIGQLHDTLDQIKSNHELLRVEAEERFDALARTLDKEKQCFLHSLQCEMAARTEAVVKQEEKLSRLSRETSSTISTARAHQETASDLEFLTKRCHVSSKLRDRFASEIDQISRLVEASPKYVEVSMLDCDTLTAACQLHTYVVRNPTEYRADVSSLASASTHEEVVVHIHTPSGGKMQCTLTLTRNGAQTGEVSVTNAAEGEYCIGVTPHQRGRHQLSILVNGKPIPGSPFGFKVKQQLTALPASLSEATTTIPCSRPFGLTCLEDGSTVLMLEEGKQRIAIIKDRVITGFMAMPSQFLAEVTTDKRGNIYVTTGETHRVLKFDSEGNFLKSIGSFGSRRSEFNFSNGICINTRDEVYVCDTGNHRIKVLNTDLKLLRILSKGREHFKSPHDIAFDKSDNVYIVEPLRIQVLSPEGDYMRTIGEGVLEDAVCIKMVATTAFFVTDLGKGCISIFSTEGKFIRSFAADSFTRPQGITVDADSFVYVTTNRHTLCIL